MLRMQRNFDGQDACSLQNQSILVHVEIHIAYYIMLEFETNFAVFYSPLEINIEEIDAFQKGERTGSVIIELKRKQVAQTKRQADLTVTRRFTFPIKFNELFFNGIVGLIAASDTAAIAVAGGQKPQG